MADLPSISAEFPVVRHTLDNGLRVLLAPDPPASVVGIAVHYDVGMRSEPAGRTALARGLFLEADWMRAPDLNESNLRLQVDVVKEVIRVNVTNRPYGGFPWLHLPAVFFTTFANAHDGYGSFEDLETATIADARRF